MKSIVNPLRKSLLLRVKSLHWFDSGPRLERRLNSPPPLRPQHTHTCTIPNLALKHSRTPPSHTCTKTPSLFITSRVSGQGNRIGPVCVCLSALSLSRHGRCVNAQVFSLLNRITFPDYAIMLVQASAGLLALARIHVLCDLDAKL